MWSHLDGLLWLVLMLLPLVALQRLLHREIQTVFLILTRNPNLTMGLFSLLFFPGVFVHELSHFLMAKLLGVRTGDFSLVPQSLPDGRLQLGYVETSKTDLPRDALIGAAPLISGALLVAYIATDRLRLLPLWEVFRHGQLDLFWLGLSLLPRVPDFPLWFYLSFAISSTMLPSPSDRHAWLPLGLLIGALLSLAWLAGAGPWMLEHLAPPLNVFLRSLATVLGLSAVIHAVLLLPVFLLHKLVARLTGLDVR